MAASSKIRDIGARLHGHIESIATEAYGQPTRVNGTQLRYRNKGALAVDTVEQIFYDHESGVGGGVFQLILNACDGDSAAAIEWAQDFIAECPELPAPRDRADQQDDDWKRNLALEIVDKVQRAQGTPAQDYLARRGIDDAKLVAQVGFLPNIREDDDALVAVATDEDDNPVAVQLTFITCDGEKSALEPVRLTYKIDSHWSAKGGVRFAGEGAPIQCEGVEDAMSCAMATGRPGIAVLGASNLGKYVPDGERCVTICPDGDDPDSAAAKRVVRACDDLLIAGIKEVLVVPLKYDDENERKVDANDVLRDFGVKVLQEIIEAAEPAQLSYEGEIRRLAAMDINECAVQIKPAHEALGERGIDVLLTAFRRAVDSARAEVETEHIRRTTITSTAPPSATLMETGDLLQRIYDDVRKYVILDDWQALLVATYVLFTHVFDCFDCCPRMMITSATRATGKSRLSQVISKMCARPLPTTNASVASLFRMIEREAPTVVIGEYDSFMRESVDHRNIVNSGHFRDEAFVWRTAGDDFEPVSFSTFAPMILSGIGRLHGTVMSRSIIIPMRRRLERERVARVDRKARERLKTNQGLVARWALDAHQSLIGTPPPEWIDGVDDRANDNAEPLLAIARMGGGQWESRCREAFVRAYAAANEPDDEDLNILALRDLRDVFFAEGQAHTGGAIFTDEVLSCFFQQPDRPWIEMPRSGRQLTAHTLGRLVRGLGAKTERVVRDGERRRGFRWETCEDGFARYLPPHSDADGATSDVEAEWGAGGSVQASAAQENCASETGHMDENVLTEEGHAVVAGPEERPNAPVAATSQQPSTPASPSPTDDVGPGDEVL
jgi:hypothetical protein